MFKYNYKLLAYILLLSLNAPIAIFIWHSNLPFPLLLNWDIYEHQTLVNLIKMGSINFFTSKISDTFTFNSYPPTFHIFILILQKIFSVTSLNFQNFWFSTQIIYFILVCSLQALLAYVFTKNKNVVIITSIFGVYIFESFGAYTSLFLIPQTLTSLLLVTLLILVYKFKSKFNKIWAAGLVLVLPFFHYIIGTLAVFTAGLLYFLSKVNSLLILKRILGILAVTTVLIAVFYNYIQINPLTSRDESFDYLLPLSQKLQYLEIWYGYFLYIFGVIGLIKAYFSKNKNYLIIAIVSMVFINLYLYPFPYTPKFWVIGRYFINILVTIGFCTILEKVKYKKVFVLLLSAALAFTFYNCQLWYKNIPNIEGKYISHYSPNELKASEFLKNVYRYDKQTLLISDPSTQYIIEAFSEVNSQGGAYMLTKNREVLIDINNSTNQEEIVNKLFLIQDELFKVKPKRIIFVLSGRYFAWQSLSENERLKYTENVWYPLTLKEKDKLYINWLKQNPSFNEVYSNEEMVILEVSE